MKNFKFRYKQVDLTVSPKKSKFQAKEDYVLCSFNMPDTVSLWDSWKLLPPTMPYSELLTMICKLTSPEIDKNILDIFISISTEKDIISLTDAGLFIMINDICFIQYRFSEKKFSVGTKSSQVADYISKSGLSTNPSISIISLFEDINEGSIESIILFVRNLKSPTTVEV